jgi:beta-mannosidase
MLERLLVGLTALACITLLSRAESGGKKDDIDIKTQSETSQPGSVEPKENLIHYDLDGPWQVSASGSNDWFDATVPGCIHTDLLAAGRIPDPFFRDNESRVQWVGEQDWTYRRSFQVSDELYAREHLLLRCEGLDTLATVFINGVELGRTDNMFRTWEFDAKSYLKPGINLIEIRFDSVLPLIRSKEAEWHLPTWTYQGTGYVRKMPCNFGWDWGPTLITCGIWRNLSLIGFDTARLGGLEILQDHSQAGMVKLNITVSAQPATGAALKAIVTVTLPDGTRRPPVECPITGGTGAVELSLDHPQLWWPAGMGAQPLYTVHAELQDARGKVLDAWQRRIGLRTLRGVPQSDSSPMQFVVNGVPFFAKGANWIPPDAFPNRTSKADLRRFMADAVKVNMNTLRFWGGGYYEDDELFDACDELGICVWMDFKFACSTYPVFDAAFLENVRREAEDQVRRLRHHPCIALWCGNNEVMFFRGKETWTKARMSEPDYYRLFDDTLGGVMRSFAPQTAFVTGSPDCGDVHFWDVWHGGKSFEAYRNVHGFLSEFGFQSYPVPATVDSSTAPEDRTGVYAPMMKYHERSNRMFVGENEDGTLGTDKIMKVVRMNFREAKDFESTLWLSQINQAYGIEFAAEGWRREMPKSMGCVYWQYNDNWPGASWSSVDYFGRWKALQYRARHFYAPLLLSGEFNPDRNKMAVWLTNDALTPVAGMLHWRVTDLMGSELRAGKKRIAAGAQKSVHVAELELNRLVRKHGANHLLVWLSFDAKGAMLADNLVLLAKPKELELRDPGLVPEVSGSGTEFKVSVRARHPALWVWLEVAGTDADLSDNFVPVTPGAPAKFTVKLHQPMTKMDFVNRLKVRSLFDTYPLPAP